jgi:hypothetical protein
LQKAFENRKGSLEWFTKVAGAALPAIQTGTGHPSETIFG